MPCRFSGRNFLLEHSSIPESTLLAPFRLLGLIALWLTCGTLPAEAKHPVSMTRAFVYVTREKATAEIEVFLEDLYLFHPLKTNSQDFLEPDTIRQGIELHKQFLSKRFTIRNAAGQTIPGRVLGVSNFEVPPDGVSLGKLMAHRMTFEIEYELNTPPEFLTFSQQFTDDEAIVPSEMKLSVKQENAEVQTVVLRPGDVETVRLNWSLPPLSPEASEEERRRWERSQREETLGITSYSSAYSFLYINDREVRHEILVPVLSLEQSILLARDDDEFLDLAEQDAARVQIEAYFRSGNPIEINGQAITPTVQRCDFYGLNFRDFAQQAPRQPVSLVSARVGVILSYPCPDDPETVKLTWNRFNSSIWNVNTIVFAYDSSFTTELGRFGNQNVLFWENPGQPEPEPIEPVKVEVTRAGYGIIPFWALGAVGVLLSIALFYRGGKAALTGVLGLVLVFVGLSGLMSYHATSEFPSSRAGEIFAQLHDNLYRAFEYKEESEVYDALDKSIHGSLLRDVYLEVQQSLKMEEQGGAISRIQEVTVLEGEIAPLKASRIGASNPTGFTYRCRWNVAGTVEHWGHIHERTNQYHALFTVEQVDEFWKVTHLELLDEKRVQFETRVRS